MNILVLCVSAALLALVDGKVLVPKHPFRVVCYMASWAVYLQGNSQFDISDAKPALPYCTHIVYLFAKLDPGNYQIKPMDTNRDIDGGGLERTVALKTEYPHVKVLIGVGGWNDGSAAYSRMASSEKLRTAFIQSATMFILENALDGMDLNWQFPGDRGGAATDKKSFLQLIKELRREFDKHGLIISAAVSSFPERIVKGVDAKGLSTYAHFLNILSYEYHTYLEKKIRPSAPLIAKDEKSVDNTIKRYLQPGSFPFKLNLGISAYGTTFLLADPNANFVGQPSSETGLKARVTYNISGAAAKETSWHGPYNQVDGFIAYNELCEVGLKQGWTYAWDQLSQTPYLFKGDRVVSYDDLDSITAKVKVGMENKLGGIIFYGLEKDDFKSKCNSSTQAPFVLLRAVDTALKLYQDLAYNDLYDAAREYSADHFWNFCLGSTSECATRI